MVGFRVVDSVNCMRLPAVLPKGIAGGKIKEDKTHRLKNEVKKKKKSLELLHDD